MNYSVFRFTLNMHNHRSQASVATFCGDTAVRLNINLTDGGNAYFIEDGCTAWLSGTKADGTKLWHRCVIINNTTIQYDFLEQTTSRTGLINCEIILYGADGSEITAPKFTIVVDEREVNDIDITEEDERLLAGIALAEEARLEAEGSRAEAETVRALAEEERVVAEAERVAAETERVEAQAQREQALDEIIDNALAEKLDAGNLTWNENKTVLSLEGSFIKSSMTTAGFSAEDTNGQSVNVMSDSVKIKTNGSSFFGTPHQEAQYEGGCIVLTNYDKYTTSMLKFPDLPDGSTATLATLDDIPSLDDIPEADVEYTLTEADKAEIAELVVETSMAEIETAKNERLAEFESGADLIVEASGTEIEAKKDASLAEIEEAKAEMLSEIERVAGIVQTTGTSETAVMSQKAVTNIASTSASIFLTGECAFYKERVSGYTYIKITSGKLAFADKFLGKVAFSWDEIIANISASYIATSPKGIAQCIKITENGTCLVFNVSTKTFALKTMQTVDSGAEIVLFFDNYGIHGGLLYSKAENVANTLATVVLNPSASLQIEYASGYQYMKVIDPANKGNDKVSIYNKRLGALTFTWSQVLADINTSYVSKAPSEADGTTATFVKLAGNQCLYYNPVTRKFYAGSLNSVDTEIGIVLYYHTYDGSGGALYEQYADRLNVSTRGAVDNLSNTVTKNEAKKIDYDDFLAIAQTQAKNTATIAENDAGITEVKFKRANETTVSTMHCYFRFDVKPFDTIILEFYGKSSHPDYDPTDANAGRFEVLFADKDGNRVGNQYHAYVLGKNRCGYHRYGYVVPLGVTRASFNLYTKGGCEVTLHNLNAKVLKDYNFSNRERQGIKYDAHLGLIMSAPENTLPTFELVKKAGFSTCISNCNWTKDDVLVCLHNDEIASKTYEKASGNVQDYTYAELQAFDFGYYTSYYKAYKGTRLPKLEDFVKLMASMGVAPIFRLHSDWYTAKTAKAKDYLAQIYSWICKYGFKGKACVKAFDIRVLNDCYDVMGKDVEYVLDCESLSTTALNYVAQYKEKGIDLTLEFPDSKVYTDTTNPITNEHIANAVANGVNLSAYTVNSTAVMRDLFLKGIPRFCTDTFSDIVFPIE